MRLLRLVFPAIWLCGPGGSGLHVLLHVLELGGDLPLVTRGVVAGSVHLSLLLGPLFAAVPGHHGLVLVVVVVLILILVLVFNVRHCED